MSLFGSNLKMIHPDFQKLKHMKGIKNLAAIALVLLTLVVQAQ